MGTTKRVGGGRSNSVCTLLKKWIVKTLAKVIKGGGVNKFLESYLLSGLIKGGGGNFV